MLYEIEIQETVTPLLDSDHISRYETYVVESPTFQHDGSRIRLPRALNEFALQRAHEASVSWGFVKVEITVSQFFPARVGMPKDNGSCVRSILKEQTYQCPTRAVTL